jgi:hypothetical protein
MITNTFFCPNPKCINHNPMNTAHDWLTKNGTHMTLAFGVVQRYRCKTCNHTFSNQTFSLNYYLKIKTNFSLLFDQFNSANSDCFIARHFDMSFDSVQLRRDRLARNAMFLQIKLMETYKIDEAVCIDGLESYTQSKYYPNNLNIMVGSKSLFIYYFTESMQRRKGMMSQKQKDRCLTEYAGKSFSDSRLSVQFNELLTYLNGNVQDDCIEIRTDEHKTYKQVIENGWSDSTLSILHKTTPSTQPRTKKNPLFPVNYIDRQIRKDCPNHRRKTVCQAKNDRNMASRFVTYMVSHNFFKPKHILSRKMINHEHHCDGFGLDKEMVRYWKKLFLKDRFFHSKIDLPKYFDDIWFKRIPTPLKVTADYVPKHAFM